MMVVGAWIPVPGSRYIVSFGGNGASWFWLWFLDGMIEMVGWNVMCAMGTVIEHCTADASRTERAMVMVLSDARDDHVV